MNSSNLKQETSNVPSLVICNIWAVFTSSFHSEHPCFVHPLCVHLCVIWLQWLMEWESRCNWKGNCFLYFSQVSHFGVCTGASSKLLACRMVCHSCGIELGCDHSQYFLLWRDCPVCGNWRGVALTIQCVWYLKRVNWHSSMCSSWRGSIECLVCIVHKERILTVQCVCYLKRVNWMSSMHGT